jgi:hypothetical protein
MILCIAFYFIFLFQKPEERDKCLTFPFPAHTDDLLLSVRHSHQTEACSVVAILSNVTVFPY